MRAESRFDRFLRSSLGCQNKKQLKVKFFFIELEMGSIVKEFSYFSKMQAVNPKCGRGLKRNGWVTHQKCNESHPSNLCTQNNDSTPSINKVHPFFRTIYNVIKHLNRSLTQEPEEHNWMLQFLEERPLGNCVDGGIKTAKTCFVLLESLDQRILDQYLRKNESTVNCKSITKEHKKRAKYESRSVKGHSETALKDYFKRRRKKVRAKPLHYTDDEDECTSANPKENILVNEQPKSETLAKDSGTPNETVPENPDLNGWKKSDGKERNVLKSSLNKTASSGEESKSDVRSLEATLQKDREDFPKNTARVQNIDIDDYNLGRVKSEVDVVEELGKCGSFKRESNRDERGKECEWEAEMRDEDEDDKATVVFDKNLSNGVADIEEVLELTEEKIGSVKKKFRKKKMNRKKRKLIKFKRKRSMMGRNLAKVKKLKTKWSQQPAEKESVSERNVREVCALVKRLHELYRIILQLQKDLPMDAKQADYLIETVNAQQKNFYKEIKKSQKIIMRGYDRMLNSFGSANTVSLEIGKRTSLSKEDIANVISKCTLQGGSENRKRAAGTLEQELNSQEVPLRSLGAGPNSKRIKKPGEKGGSLQEMNPPQFVHEISTQESLGSALNHPDKNPVTGLGNAEGMTDPNPFSSPSGHPRPSKSLQRSNNEPKMAKEVEGRENHPTTYFLHLPSNSFRVSQPLRNSFQGHGSDQSKPRPHFGAQYNCTPRAPVAYREPRFRQFPHHDPRDVRGNQARPLSSRHVHNHSSNIRAQYRGGSVFPNHGHCTTGVSYPPNKNSVEFFRVADGFVPIAPPMSGPAPRLPVPSLMDINPYPLGYSQVRLPPNRFPHVPDACSLARGAGIAYFDRPRHHTPSQANKNHKNYSSKHFNNFGRRNNFPPSKSSESGVSGAPKEGQCPLKTLLTNFSRVLQPNAPIRTCAVTDPLPNPDQTCSLSTDPAGGSESPILDPTVPQKLTMRNCRLEAGPILKPKSDGFPDVREASAPSVTADSSREYVCAQNGCKNPGVRICKGCLSIIYCSETCQLKHWTLKHKMECHQLKELRG